MKLVTVAGPTEVLAGLRAVAGVEQPTRGIELDHDWWQASCRATDEAIAALTAAGCDVTVVLDDQALADHDAEARSAGQASGQSEDPVG